MIDYEILRLVWWVLIGVLFIGFAITDGYDIGAANLLPVLGRDEMEKRLVINAVAPHWDGNQVWLITAGGALFAAWPTVYATAFSGFYWALLLVLFALILRPIAFDYRSKIDDPKWRNICDRSLFISGFVPSLIFGVAFGNLFQGYEFTFNEYMQSSFTGSFFDLLNPFALLCGLVSVSMLTMHGASWLKLRTEEEMSQRASRIARLGALLTLVLFAVAGLWVGNIPGYEITSVIDGNAASNPAGKTVEVIATGAWLANYSKYPLMMVAPVLGFVGLLGVLLLSATRQAGLNFTCSALAQAGIIMTAGFSLFPFILPSSSQPEFSLTLWDATSSYLTLGIMTVVAGIMVPTILGYTIWCFYQLWGRISRQHIAENSHSLY
ncbi:cytochrome d ubiquinol oxidase subunit II [Spongorhabdus nitratireducens]